MQNQGVVAVRIRHQGVLPAEKGREDNKESIIFVSSSLNYIRRDWKLEIERILSLYVAVNKSD